MLDKKALSIAAAKNVAAAASAEAKKNGWTVCIAIVDDGGNLLYFERADGTQLGSIGVSMGKARTALLFKRPSKALEDAVAGGRAAMMTLSPEVVTVEGGVPLVYGGNVVGAIGVSGVQSAQDAQIARAGAEVLTR
ncbi:MAG: heme-binding protein [Rhodospirillales bacterium]|nr:heme-binding protein [Rhodospirillales bacterium]